MSHLNGVALFVQVAESGSFVEAARLAGVSPSAASKSMTRLEARLGVRLFQRSTRSLSLTAEGRNYLDTCRHVLSELEAAELQLGHAHSAPQGLLRISLPMVSGFLLPALSDFSRLHTAVQLDIVFTDRLVDVIGEGFDVVVRTGPLQDSRLLAKTLRTFKNQIVGAPDYFARHGSIAHPKDLERHACLHYRFSHSGKCERWHFRPDPAFDEPRLPMTMVCNSLETRIHFARQGLGLAWVPDFAVESALQDGTLLSVLDDFIDHTDRFSMVWPRSRQTTPKVRAFIDFMHQRMA